MPRSNRPKGRRAEESGEVDLSRALRGARHVESRGGADWNVQPQAAEAAVKTYICPGCGRGIAPGTAHLVAWRADGLLGEVDDLRGRRHWHTTCWRIGGGA